MRAMQINFIYHTRAHKLQVNIRTYYAGCARLWMLIAVLFLVFEVHFYWIFAKSSGTSKTT